VAAGPKSLLLLLLLLRVEIPLLVIQAEEACSFFAASIFLDCLLHFFCSCSAFVIHFLFLRLGIRSSTTLSSIEFHLASPSFFKVVVIVQEPKTRTGELEWLEPHHHRCWLLLLVVDDSDGARQQSEWKATNTQNPPPFLCLLPLLLVSSCWTAVSCDKDMFLV
jgi:hypothetical protein